jgi:serine/threonine protein kinase
VPRIIDFGRQGHGPAADREDAVDEAGMLIGTPDYMSPNSGSGAPRGGHQTDVRALGVIL